MELFEVLRNRHSTRSFDGKPVPREVLDQLLEAASLAPSSLNEQPWVYYVATGDSRSSIVEHMTQSTHYLEEYLEVLGHEATEEVLQWYGELGDAPVIMVVTMPAVDDDFARLNKHLSVGASIENLLLAATDLGLGACNVTFSFWVRDELAGVLGIPDDRVIVAMITVGYPGEVPPRAPVKRHDIAVYLD